MTEPSTDVPTIYPPRHARKLFLRGIVASAAYAGALAIYAFVEREALLQMKPDQFATFLSGVFAPLAFLWLVLGFRQQGDELKNSAHALLLQGEELRNSVEQQRQLVEVSREQLAAEFAERQRAEEAADNGAQPRLLMPQAGGSYSGRVRTLHMAVTSAGPTCSDVKLFVGGRTVASAEIFGETNRINFNLDYSSPEEVQPVLLTVAYTDNRGNFRAQSFTIPVNDSGGANGDRTLGDPVKIAGYRKLAGPGMIDEA